MKGVLGSSELGWGAYDTGWVESLDYLALDTSTVQYTYISRFLLLLIRGSFIHKLPLLGVFDASYVELLFGPWYLGGYPSKPRIKIFLFFFRLTFPSWIQ